MEIILSIVLIIFGILQIVLFFKIWEMTNDVSRIKNLLEYSNNTNKHKQKVDYQKTIEDTKNQSGNVNATVMTSYDTINLYEWVTEIASRKEFQVMEIYENGRLLCMNEENPDGKIFERFEIEK